MTTEFSKGFSSAMRRGSVVLTLTAVLLAGCGDKPSALVESAKEYQSKGDHQAAIIQLRNALQQDPKIAEARFLLAQSLLLSNDLATAEKELRKALELGHPEDLVVPVLARTVVDQGRGGEALKEFGARSLKTPQGQAALQTALGDAYTEQGREKDARAAFAAALAAVPDYVPARVGEARLYAVRGEMDEAARRADEILRGAPKHPDALNLRASIYAVQRQYKQAAELYAQAIEIEPHKHAMRRALVNTLVLDNQIDKAVEAVASAKKAGGGNDPRLIYQEALLNMRTENYARARDLSQQILRVLPDDLPTMLIAGGADLYLGNYEPAQDILNRVLERAPRHDGARRLLIAAYVRSGQPARAIEVLQPLLQRPEVDSATLFLAGEVYLAANNLVRAEDYLSRASKMDQSNVALRTRLGQVRLATGESEAGIEDLEKASAADAGQANADLLLVLGHMREKQYDKAKAALEILEKKQPNNPGTHNVKGTMLAAMGDLTGARAAFAHALELKPDNFAALVNLARLDIKDKRPDVARNRFEAVIEKQPQNDQLMLTYAQFLNQTGAPPETVVHWTERAVKANPSSEAARLSLMSVRAQGGDKKSLLSAAQDAMAALPNSMRILEAGGLAQLAAGDVNQAISSFNKLVKAQPKSPAALLRLAQAQLAAKDANAALDTLRKAQALAPDSTRPQTKMVEVLGSTQRFDEALVEARKIQTRFPDKGDGFALEGDIHGSQKRWKEAERAFGEALKRESDNTQLFLKIFRILELDKRPAEAEAYAARWLKAHPNDFAARVFLAERDLQAKEYKGAIKYYKSAIEIQSTNAAVLNNLAWAASQVKDPAALDYAQQAYDLAPNNPAVLDTLGMILVERGQAAKGLPYVAQAFKIAPQSTEIHFNLVKALSQTGKKDAAKRELEVLAKHENANVKAHAEELLKAL